MEEPREKTGTFLVAEADDAALVLRDVHDAEVHTVEAEAVEAEPAPAPGEVLDATLRAEPPLRVTWSIADVTDRRTIPVERSAEAPTRLARELAADQSVGELTTRERAGEGELHVLSVPEGETDEAAADVLDDAETVARAARLGVGRVEVRADDGVLSVRYLP